MDEQKNTTPSAAASVPVQTASPAASATPAGKLRISIDEFAKVELRAGKILSAEKVEKADKLLRLSVDFAEAAPRQIVSGISMHFPDPSMLVGRTVMFVTNLEPRTIRGLESNGMILAVSTEAVPATETSPEIPPRFSLLEPTGGIPPGTKAK